MEMRSGMSETLEALPLMKGVKLNSLFPQLIRLCLQVLMSLTWNLTPGVGMYRVVVNSAVQSQAAVTAYFSSKQLLLLAWQYD